MKKLMIAAAIVCAAAFVQAANVNWGNGSYSIDNPTGTEPIDVALSAPMFKDATMFLYLGTVGYEAGKGFTGLDEATMLLSAGFDAETEYTYGNVSTYGSAAVDTSVGASQAYSLILVDSTSYADLSQVKDGDHFVLRTGTSSTDYDGSIEARFATMVDYDPITGSDWTAYSSVPEPTSGLLLLLGVAGLALKRRRA